MEGVYLYLLGCLVCIVRLALRVYNDGKLTLGDISAIIFITLFSWISIILYFEYKIVLYVSKHIDGNKVLWKRK